MSRKQIALAAIDTESAVLVNFDFLDSSDGGVLEVIHQGAMKPTVIGTLRGSAIRASASTPLGPEALVRIGHKSAARRWWDNKPRKKVAALFMLAYSAGLVAFTIWAVYSFRAEPHTLVNSAQYNLSTKDGQVAFANAIMSTRYYNGSNFFSPPWIFVWVTILALGAAFRDQYRMVRRKIPRQITMYRPLTEQPHSAHKSATG